VLPNDIQKRIDADFGPNGAKGVAANLERFVAAFRTKYKHHPGDRVIRCVLQLAEGKVPDLEHYMKSALQDWRDVIYWAEYTKDEVRIFDFDLPFEYAARKNAV